MSVQIKDIKLEIKVEKPDMEEQCETGDNYTTWNVHSDQDSINASAVIKEEYDSEEDSKYIDKSNDIVNIECIYIKEEKLENQNVNEDDYSKIKKVLIEYPNIDCKNEIDIEEHPLGEMKEEPMSDSESPQDGSTSQAIANAEMNKTAEKTLCKENLAKNSVESKNSCEICKKKFTKKSYLTKHMKSHLDIRPFECEICKNKFKQAGHLDGHMLSHSGEKPYDCEICKKKFTKRWNLEVHRRTHSGEKPYECEICKKPFPYMISLTNHMRKHTGERPYECKICKKKFSTKRNLKLHTEIHSDKNSYECEICKTKFSHRITHIRHMRAKH